MEWLVQIQSELQLSKRELETSLHKIEDPRSPAIQLIKEDIKADLQDVICALQKLENENYGICEMTGEKIPEEKLKMMPTARTIFDFAIYDFYERKTVPYHSVLIH
jgi:DnaK suppressor protein